MPTSSRYLAALSLVAGGVDALFPDCTNGPLKNVTICDKSASTLSRKLSLETMLNSTSTA
jgi:beta-D-xylosidase 4